jgi:uncharacterized protein YbjT (DUF2867 family)
MTESDNVVLVVGATGNQGGATARQLLADGWQVRVLTRDPHSVNAKALAAVGANLVVGDLDDQASLGEAVAGATGVFSVQAPGGHQPNFSVDDEIRQGRAIADAAKDAGVRHFVYSSVAGAEHATGIPSWESKWQIEQYLHSIDLPATVLLPVMFMENMRSRSPVGVQPDGTLSHFLPPNLPTQLIAVHDIGVFATLAFSNPGHYLGRRIELAGDELSFTQIAAAISAAAHRSVRYQQIPLAALLGDTLDKQGTNRLLEPNGVWRADIAALREVHPQMQTFNQWLQENVDAFQSR